MTKPCPTCGMMPGAEWRTPADVAAKDAELTALRAQLREAEAVVVAVETGHSGIKEIGAYRAKYPKEE